MKLGKKGGECVRVWEELEERQEYDQNVLSEIPKE